MTGEFFWNWISQNSERLFQALDSCAGDVISEAGGVLQQEFPGLICEVCKGKGDPLASLIISADGRSEHIEAVKAVVAAAPDFPRWKVIAFRHKLVQRLYTRLEDFPGSLCDWDLPPAEA